LPLLVPRVHGRAAGDPERRARGRDDRRRRPLAPIPLGDSAAAARIDGTARDLVVRGELQQLHFDLHDDRGRTVVRRVDGARPHRHPHLGDLSHLGSAGRFGGLRPRERAIDHRLHRDRHHLGDLAATDPQTRGDELMSTTTELVTTRGRGSRPRDPRLGARRVRWWTEVGWKYPAAIIVLFYAMFPLVYVLSASFNPRGSLAGSSQLFSAFSLDNYAALGETHFWTWMGNTLYVGLTAAAGTVVMGAAAAYAFSRFRFT